MNKIWLFINSIKPLPTVLGEWERVGEKYRYPSNATHVCFSDCYYYHMRNTGGNYYTDLVGDYSKIGKELGKLHDDVNTINLWYMPSNVDKFPDPITAHQIFITHWDFARDGNPAHPKYTK